MAGPSPRRALEGADGERRFPAQDGEYSEREQRVEVVQEGAIGGAGGHAEEAGGDFGKHQE